MNGSKPPAVAAPPTSKPHQRAPIGALTRDPKLRAEAGIFYMTDQNGPTLEEMSKDQRFAKVSLKTLERWSKEDKWVERRSIFFQTWAARARERIGTELCRLRQRDLADLETVRALALDRLNDEMVLPKSWEGVAKILLEATEHRDRIATAIGVELMPGQGEQKQVTPEDVGASPEELQLAAKEILRHRRETMRLSIAAGGPRAPIDISQLDATTPSTAPGVPTMPGVPTVPLFGSPAPMTPPSVPGPDPVVIEGQYVTSLIAPETALSVGTGVDGESDVEDDRAVFENEDDFMDILDEDEDEDEL